MNISRLLKRVEVEAQYWGQLYDTINISYLNKVTPGSSNQYSCSILIQYTLAITNSHLLAPLKLTLTLPSDIKIFLCTVAKQ